MSLEIFIVIVLILTFCVITRLIVIGTKIKNNCIVVLIPITAFFGILLNAYFFRLQGDVADIFMEIFTAIPISICAI